MKKPIPRVPLILSFLGVVPFVIQFFLFALQLTDAEYVLQLATWNRNFMYCILGYAFAILIFLAGVDWGLAVNQREKKGVGAYIWSVTMFLGVLGVVSFLFFHKYVFSILAILYGIAWFGSYVLYRCHYSPEWYLRLRCLATPAVLACLLALQVLLYFVAYVQ